MIVGVEMFCSGRARPCWWLSSWLAVVLSVLLSVEVLAIDAVESTSSDGEDAAPVCKNKIGGVPTCTIYILQTQRFHP